MSWNWLPIAKDIFETLFYIITGVAVVVGLWGWKKELRGKTQYETAKNVIAGAYRVRDAINSARFPYIFSLEWADRQSHHENAEENSLYAYTKRYQAVTDALTQWHPAAVEAEALFGKDAKDRIADLKISAIRLKAVIEAYHWNITHNSRLDNREAEPSADSRKIYLNILNGYHPGMSEAGKDSSSYADSGFQEKLDAAVLGIKEHFSKFIK